ncbi:MAG: Ig-like domain repeat protein [Clostridia bacterium]|nr:Ig-like domain repeat protein [Clostridia bacterium]
MSVTHGLKAFKLMVEVPDDAAAGSTYTVDFDELCQIFKYNYEGARDLFTTAVVPLTIKVAQPSSYTVQLTASANMTKTEGSGSASQTVSIGSAITDVVYTANNGYYFPENYAVESMNGLTVTRNGWTQITISGTPTDNVTKTLKAPTAKSMPQMYISAPEVDHSMVSNVRVYLPDDATGTVEISLDGANNSRSYHAVAIENGMAQITEQLPADTYAVTATYGGNDKYTITGAISTLVVKKAMPDFTLKAEMSKDSNTAVITVTLPEDCTDPVDILIKDPTAGEESITIGREKFSKGTATYEYTPAMAGKYLVSATYWGDDNYLPDISYINFINPMIVDANGAVYGKESTITATLPDNATGTVTFLLEGKDSVETLSYVVPVQNGKAQLSEKLPANDTYVLTATYSGDGNYDDAVRTCSFVVGKAESSVTLEVMPVNLVYGETLTISAYLEIDGEFVKDHIDPDTGNPANAPGSIYITVDGKNYYTVAVDPEDVLIELNGGVATLKVDGLGAGQHLIEAVFAGNSNYLECSEIIDITLDKAVVQEPTAISNLTYNGTEQTGVAYDESLGYTLVIGSSISATDAGDYSASFAVDNNHKWANTNDDLVTIPWSIDPATPEITLTATPKNDAKTEYDITFTIPADAVGAVTFTLTAPSGNEQICNVNSSYFVNGVYTIHVPEFGTFFKETGEYQIVVSYSNNSFYNNNYENVPDAATVKFKLGCDHVWNAPTWDWDDYEHPKYRAECSLCDDGEIEGQVASIPGERVEATHENDAYTPYTASVMLNNQTYTDTYNLVEKGTALQKCETDFNAYKNNLISAILERALDGDSDASTTIIDNAIEDVNSLPYDESKTYDQNIAAVDYEGVLGRLDEALADQRAADAVTRKINNIGDVTLTDESKEKIDAAREAYNKLTDDQKSLVKNYKTLTDAEAAYALLENTAAFNTQKDTQQAEIDKLVSTGDSEQCEALIEKAREDIEKASYDNDKTPEQNEEALKAIVTQLAADLAEHRAVHYAEFIADGKTLAAIPYTIDTASIEAPEIPEKTGYTSKWPAYTLKAGGITVNAEYTLITYTATFKADGKEVASVPFNINTTSISEPSVPKKNGFEGTWEAYTLGAKNITINAVYENITRIAIKDHSSKLEYKDNVTYEADVNEIPDGAEIHWFVNGEDVGTGESFTVEKPTDDYTIQAKVIGSDGTVFTASETETILVKHTFWAKMFYYTMYKVYLVCKAILKAFDIFNIA